MLIIQDRIKAEKFLNGLRCNGHRTIQATNRSSLNRKKRDNFISAPEAYNLRAVSLQSIEGSLVLVRCVQQLCCCCDAYISESIITYY
jgi:hypothetical protein